VRVLLDECVDARLAREISGHDVTTVPKAGWAGLKDRPLLERAEAVFDAFVTTDRNLENQQNLANYDLAIIVLEAKTNRLADLKPLVPSLLATLPTATRGQATHVTA
jgi:predicted nuclease of predicted toxin-antitoxin system